MALCASSGLQGSPPTRQAPASHAVNCRNIMADLYIAFYTSRAARKLAYSALKIVTLATGRQALSVTGACRLDRWL
jgi:hypothetical protein